jgi:hypothetical protein
MSICLYVLAASPAPHEDTEPGNCGAQQCQAVKQHRTGTLAPIPDKRLMRLGKRHSGGVPIGADRDPAVQADGSGKSKACFRFGRGPTSVLTYTQAGGERPFSGCLADPASSAIHWTALFVPTVSTTVYLRAGERVVLSNVYGMRHDPIRTDRLG